MNVSDTSSAGAAALAQSYSVAVAKKAEDAQQVNAQSTMQLIQSARAPQLQPGQSINVMA